MKDEMEILERLNKLMDRRLKARTREYLSRSSRNCVSGTRARVRGVGHVIFCTNQKVLERIKEGVLPCDDEAASKCECYECRNTRESVKQDFDDVVHSPARCGEEYPKMAILLWFLQGSKETTRKMRFLECLAWLRRLITFKWW